MALHPKSDDLLLKICRAYNTTHSKRMDTSDIPALNYDDSFFYELEETGYIKFINSIAPNIEILDKTVSLAQKLI